MVGSICTYQLNPDIAQGVRGCRVADAKGLPAGTSPGPIECQRCVPGVPQPLCDFFCLEGQVFEFEVTIEQLGNLFGGARFPDLVQRSRNVLVETTRIWTLAHFRFQFLKP